MRRPAAQLVLAVVLATLLPVAAGLTIGVVAGTLMGAGSAHACSCAALSDDEAFAAADVVFTGTVIGVDLPDVALGSMGPKRYTLDVDAVYRGEAATEQVVVTPVDPASCGSEIGAGRWLVFATAVAPGDERVEGKPEAAAGELRTGLCSGTRALGASPVPASFGPARGPSVSEAGAPSSGAAVGDEDRAAGFVVMVVAVVVFVAGFVLLAVRSRRRRGAEG
jgi:hypothetical protein